ncbi:MAG: hypothetical protein JNL81_09980 [Hyphomonadaceae bacterium]|nr:hypothetical protein [Hyphomonadaceae bacterium]
MEWGVNEYVAVGSALLAVISLVFNWLVVNKQTELQTATLRVEMDSEVIAWSQEAIDAVSDGVALARGRGAEGYTPGEFRRTVSEASQRLSSLADRGRLFFPNHQHETHGAQKERAFQGYRQPILDAVVFACARLDRMDTTLTTPDTATADYLVKCRRLLVSEAQNAVDPRRSREMLDRLDVGRRDDKVSAFRTAAEIGEEMEALFPGFLLERRDEAWIAARQQMSRRR